MPRRCENRNVYLWMVKLKKNLSVNLGGNFTNYICVRSSHILHKYIVTYVRAFFSEFWQFNRLHVHRDMKMNSHKYICTQHTHGHDTTTNFSTLRHTFQLLLNKSFPNVNKQGISCIQKIRAAPLWITTDGKPNPRWVK